MDSIKRKELEKNLKLLLVQNSLNKKVIDSVKRDLSKLGIFGGTVQEIFNQQIPINNLNESVLYHLSASLSKLFSTVTPLKFFSYSEIEMHEEKLFLMDSKNKDVSVKLNKVEKLGENNFMAYFSTQEIIDLYRKLRFNAV